MKPYRVFLTAISTICCAQAATASADVEAVLLGINPFDQFGVELGKTLAGPIVAAIESDVALPEGSSASTRGLVAHVRSLATSARP